MKTRIAAIAASLIIAWLILAASCQKRPQSALFGAIWNRANASTEFIWNWYNPSATVFVPIYNPANPSYQNCSSFSENYAPEGTLLQYAPDTASYNPVPFCWNCHGGGSIWMPYDNYSTGMAHGNGSPMMYGE